MTMTIPNPGLGKEEDGCKVCLLLAPPPLLEDSAFARSGGLSGQDTFRQVRSQASGVVGQVTSDTLKSRVRTLPENSSTKCRLHDTWKLTILDHINFYETSSFVVLYKEAFID